MKCPDMILNSPFKKGYTEEAILQFYLRLPLLFEKAIIIW